MAIQTLELTRTGQFPFADTCGDFFAVNNLPHVKIYDGGKLIDRPIGYDLPEKKLTQKAFEILDKKGLFLITYPMPEIHIVKTTDEFRAFRDTIPPAWATIYEDDVGRVVIHQDFLQIPGDLSNERTAKLAHELGHGVHNQALKQSFENVTDEEIKLFKRTFIRTTRHLGILEGLMEQISRGEPNWELVFTILKEKGMYDLDTIKTQMLEMDRWPNTNYNPSYLSAHAWVNGISKYISQNTDTILDRLEEQGIVLLSEYERGKKSNHYTKLSGEAILFRIEVEYLIRMFELYRSGDGKAVEFEDFLGQMTGESFEKMKQFAWNQLSEKAQISGFKPEDLRLITFRDTV